MAYLKKLTKSVLLLLAEEFNTTVSQANKVKEIIEAIQNASDYDEETGKAFLERILDEIAQDKLEKERLEKEKERERLEKEKNLEFEERERVRQFELEKLKLMAASETNSTLSVRSEPELNSKKVNLKNLVPKFDPKEIDISLFFLIFERQATRANLNEDEWVSQLIPLLPVTISEIIVKEPTEKADDFQHIKQVLFKRFKLSARALKNKLDTHNKKYDALWSDLVYELRNYLENWLESVKVTTFEGLKELILTEQLKKRVPINIREHYIESWEEIIQASVLAEKCDKYDSVRKDMRNFEPRSGGRNSLKKSSQYETPVTKPGKDSKSHSEKSDKKASSSKINSEETKTKFSDRNFDKERVIKCFECHQSGHIRPNCPVRLNKLNYPVNNLNVCEKLGEDFKPYIHSAKINGELREYLRDSGSCIDVCESDMITVEDLLPESVDVKQPFDSTCISLPLARIEIEGDFGKIIAKAAVKPAELSQGYYLMGNRTAELIEEKRKKMGLPVNAIFTRSMTKSKTETSQNDASGETKEIVNLEGNKRKVKSFKGKEVNNSSFELEILKEEDPFFLPQILEGEKFLNGISAEDFLDAQKNCSTLKGLWDKAKGKEKSEFSVYKGRLIRTIESKKGEEKIQLVVPLKFREEILKLCHGSISGHLGVTKTKDRILDCFFWPKCYQEIEAYVRTCDPCQKIGTSKDKKKAPLKLVPIISEPFRRLSIDAVGPLIKSKYGNSYLITAVCVASKYPDAIPVENLESKTVIHALLQIFSKIGFPCEIQSDLGRSFTSELTTLFFMKYGIKVSHSSLCHPESNSVERMHSTLKKVLKVLCLEQAEDWERVLPMALFALRTVVHESTGFSPAELIHGKNLRMPHTIVYENWLQEDEVSQNVVDYILDLNSRLKRCQDLAVETMTKCQLKRKLWYDKNAVSRKFKVGDMVLVLATSKAHKMAVSWLGPGVVTSVISDTNYTVDLPEKRNKNTIYHVNLLKPYLKRPEFLNLIIEDKGEEEIEDEVCIPYPTADSTHFDFTEITKNSNLEGRISPENLRKLHRLLIEYRDVFSADPGVTSLVKMDIKLIDENPVRAKPYRMSSRQTEILRTEIQRLLDLGVIEVGQSDYASPMILVESPGKDPRPCIDYRALNSKTRVEFFPLPNIEEVVEKVSSAPYISIMDLSKGYFQIELTEAAQRYAAFVTPFGSFIPKRMMFGLINSPYYFCKLMSIVLGGLESFVLPYIDDMSTYSSDWNQHMKHLDEVLKRLRDAGLKVKPSKCLFAQDHVRFLGHEVGSGKRSPSEVKIKAIQDFPKMQTKTQVRSFLGLTGFYARYIENYAVKAAPLTDLLKGKIKKEKIEWNDSCEKAYKSLKDELIKSPVLYAPDFSKEFIVQADASGIGAGIVLSQKSEEGEHPILYLSKKFSKAERNYSTTERELAAIVYGLKKLNHYLDGQKFVLQTDHNPLVYLRKMLGTNSRLTRWALFLQTYNFSIRHKPGKHHQNADALSRLLED